MVIRPSVHPSVCYRVCEHNILNIDNVNKWTNFDASGLRGKEIQAAQLSQRDCATLSLNISLSHSRSYEMTLVSRAHSISRAYSISIPLKLCLYLVPFLRYLTSNNGMTFKSGLKVVQGRWKWCRSIDHIRLFIGRPLQYSCMLCHFQVIWRWIIVTLKVTKGHSNWYQSKAWGGLLFAFHSNYGRIFNRLWDIQRQRITWSWNLN